MTTTLSGNTKTGTLHTRGYRAPVADEPVESNQP